MFICQRKIVLHLAAELQAKHVVSKYIIRLEQDNNPDLIELI